MLYLSLFNPGLTCWPAIGSVYQTPMRAEMLQTSGCPGIMHNSARCIGHGDEAGIAPRNGALLPKVVQDRMPCHSPALGDGIRNELFCPRDSRRQIEAQSEISDDCRRICASGAMGVDAGDVWGGQKKFVLP